jgi:hypothetical protein
MILTCVFECFNYPRYLVLQFFVVSDVVRFFDPLYIDFALRKAARLRSVAEIHVRSFHIFSI